jgi:hypothetical protein
MDNGFIYIYNLAMECVGKTKIYDFDIDKEKFMTFIDDIEFDNVHNIIVINLNTRKEYYKLSDVQPLVQTIDQLLVMKPKFKHP